MDSLRGRFDALDDDDQDLDLAEEDSGADELPAAIGQDERRMQVRAYNHWASLLEDRNFPAIEDLEPEALPDFGPYSVLLDFTSGLENPGIAFLGQKLANECDASTSELQTLDDIPSRSLLSRITDHYMQILANQAPIGFEAEFVNQRGATIMYRGILLPFSSDDETIDFIYGVINWKELADPQSSDELLLEIDQALEPMRPAVAASMGTPLTDWADGPGALAANDQSDDNDFAHEDEPAALPSPSFGLVGDDDYEDEDEDEEDGSGYAPLTILGGMPRRDAPMVAADEDHDVADGIGLPALDPQQMELGDWLGAAREMAAAARTSEDRTRNALYDAVGLAHDFSLAAADEPQALAELIEDAGLTMQDRAPMTPLVKLVFGADYDKTRLTEYAAALSHAHRLGLEQGTLGDFLRAFDGGLKGVVKAERRLRREEAGKQIEPLDAPRRALATRLRAMPARDFTAIAPHGSEFALVMIRRGDAGEVTMLGEVPEDISLVERAARKLLD